MREMRRMKYESGELSNFGLEAKMTAEHFDEKINRFPNYAGL